jgi:GMP synthase PP-ATPase subunit
MIMTDDADVEHIEESVRQVARTYGYDACIIRGIRSVGVMGDGRAYTYVAEIIGKYDPDVIAELSTKITNEICGVNRVVIRLKPPVTNFLFY